MQRLLDAIDRETLLLDVPERDLASVFAAALDRLIELDRFPRQHRDHILAELLRREEKMSTAIGHAVAVPHIYSPELTEPNIVFVRLARPLNLNAPDRVPVRFFILLLGPDGIAVDEHLDTLTGIARVMSDEECRYQLGAAQDREQLRTAIQDCLARLQPPAVKPEQEPEGLEYTGRIAGGLRHDVQRRWTHYASDLRDGFQSKCIGSTLFLFFACLAPTVTFGGLMGTVTEGNIGTIETIIGTAIGGMLFALLAGQPLLILGTTGPLLVFLGILFDLSNTLGVAYLPFYAWTGIWSALFLVVLVLLDCNVLIRYFTRFTDEIFAALISLIFITKAGWNIFAYLRDARQGDLGHDTAFLSFILAMGTFYVATSLKSLRSSHYLIETVREFFADFGPTIAVLSMVAMTFYFPTVGLESLDVPDSIRPTSERAWLVPLLPDGFPVWAVFVAIGPALLLTVLMYVDQNITSRLVNSPDHALRRGPGYHLDLLVVSGLMVGCVMFGLPLLVAATVRSLNHVRSLAQFEQIVTPGEAPRDRIIHVEENRITGFSVHLLMGSSLLILSLLKLVPMPVLYGLFLYMGIVSISGNQFFDRLSLFFRDSNLYPQTHYLRVVSRRKVSLFTLLQLICLGILWGIKEAPATLSILFPLFIALLVPVRMWVGRYFTPAELAALDANAQPDEE